jgi:signal transduction histidine kinase
MSLGESDQMNPRSDWENQGRNPSLPQESAYPNRSHGEEADFIALGIAFAVLMHRLNNTIGALNPYLARLRGCLDRYVKSDDMAALDTVRDTIGVMERIVGDTYDLMTAVKVLGKPTEQPTPLDVNSLLYEVWEELSANHTSKTVQVSFDFPESIPPVRADSHLLAEVFRAVLENSLEAVDEESGRINIRSRYKPAGQVVQIEIEDNGVGIPESILSHLFQRPISSTDSNKGLGLWLARLVLARFGGSINVKHTEIDRGTVIAITLPAFQALKAPTGQEDG